MPLGFISRKITDTESRYSTFFFYRELLAAQASMKHFRHFCKVRAFQLWTYHKPLVTALSRVSVPISPQQQRHLTFTSEFNVQLLYLPGLKNVVADLLSRPLLDPLNMSLPRQRQIWWISKRWPLSKTAAQKRTFLSSTATRRSRNRLPIHRGGFCMPGTGGAFTASTEAVPVPSTGTATEVRPLTSPPSS